VTVLADALFSKAKQKVLGVLLANPERSLHLRELARQAGVTPSTIQRELKTLADAGVLTMTARGSLTIYQANARCPIFAELCGIVAKTFGIADQVREALIGGDIDIDIAFIFGSVAKGAERTHSDVDVFVIGTGSYRDLLIRLRPVENAIGREINAKYYRPDEFRASFADGNAFLHRIAAEPKIYLIGDDDGFKACQPT